MILAVALGGAIGATGRYFFAARMYAWMGPHFPLGTLGVNIIGSLALGIVVELTALRFDLSPEWRSFLMVGLLGGFTTFSAFALDIAVMLERKDMVLAGLYAAGSVGGSVLGFFLGLWLVRAILT